MMLCEHCRERQANVHITQVVNDKRVELNLCETCYQKEAGKFNLLVQPDLNIHSLLSGLFQLDAHTEKAATAKDPACTGCGLTFSDFTSVGQLGCSSCYQVFQSELAPVLHRIHGQAAHVGKVPLRTGGQVRVRKEIAGLKAQLQEAVQREAYEEAARLRDQIRQREEELGRENGGVRQ